MKPEISIRKARIKDIKEIQRIINFFAQKDLMLARSLNELYENLRDFWVVRHKHKILGCCALHISWDDLVEIKSLAVRPEYHKKGLGRKLVGACLNEARSLQAKKVFVLTYKPEYFRQFGFRRIEHSKLPHKIWAECINCSKFPDCQETAMLKVI
jgi:amino-acid N-acetyltransferase